MIISFIKKLSLSLTTVLLAGFAVSAAHAQTNTLNFITFQNQIQDETVEISDVSWSGSYNPQFSTSTVPPNQSVSGTLRTVLPFGQAGFNFRAKVFDVSGTAIKDCYFTMNVSNSTGQLSLVSSSNFIVGSGCEDVTVAQNPPTSNSVLFRMVPVP